MKIISSLLKQNEKWNTYWKYAVSLIGGLLALMKFLAAIFALEIPPHSVYQDEIPTAIIIATELSSCLSFLLALLYLHTGRKEALVVSILIPFGGIIFWSFQWNLLLVQIAWFFGFNFMIGYLCLYLYRTMIYSELEIQQLYKYRYSTKKE